MPPGESQSISQGTLLPYRGIKYLYPILLFHPMTSAGPKITIVRARRPVPGPVLSFCMLALIVGGVCSNNTPSPARFRPCNWSMRSFLPLCARSPLPPTPSLAHAVHPGALGTPCTSSIAGVYVCWCASGCRTTGPVPPPRTPRSSFTTRTTPWATPCGMP